MTFVVPRSDEQLFEKIQKQARSCQLEGFIMASTPTTIKMIACGVSADLDLFLDKIDEVIATLGGQEVAIDPFLKDKDYRGVFRIML
jgi:acylphosphatase